LKPLTLPCSNGSTFVSTAGSGFDAHVANMFAQGEKRGFLRYVMVTAREYLRYPSRHYEVHVNGEVKNYFAWVFIFCNSKQFGNGASSCASGKRKRWPAAHYSHQRFP
jgi:diacylglycerol kinase (ATP)